MISILGRVPIENFQKFAAVFSTRGAEMRQKHGSRGAQLFKVQEEDGRAVVLFEWESREAFEAFRNDPMVKQTMQSGGIAGPPEFTFLEKAGDYPA